MERDMPLLLTVAAGLAGLAAGLLVWLALSALLRLQPDGARRTGGDVPVLFRLFLPLARRVAPLLRRREALEPLRVRTDTRLVQAGRDQDFSPDEFLALRVVYALCLGVLGVLFLGQGSRLMSTFGLVVLLFGAAFPGYWLGSQVRQRHRAIQRALPNVLDLMTLSVEAGRDFLTALHDILQQRPKDPLGEELERVFREVQLGKPRRQSLRSMATRVQQPDLVIVVETLAQADELGVSIGNILRILGDQMRQKRFQHAEKLANEAPVKLLLPLFLFIFPAVFIVMLGPVLMRSLHQFMR
jgi:tight adherence protein C